VLIFDALSRLLWVDRTSTAAFGIGCRQNRRFVSR